MSVQEQDEALVLQTLSPSLTLRQFEVRDAETLFKLIAESREHLSQWREPTSRNYPDLKSAIRSITHPKNPSKIRFGIWNGDCLVGSINLIPMLGDDAEIGYWIGKRFCRCGFASLATLSISAYAFRQGFKSISAKVHIGNVASEKVLLRTGFSRVGLEGSYLLYQKVRS